MDIRTENYKKDGMYLHFDNGDFFDLSDERIRELGEQYWNDPVKIPAEIRANDAFKTCTVCPYRGQAVFCSAMKPLLPFLENIDKFSSYDRVTAVYLRKGVMLCAPDVSLQDALQYVTNMALFEYCEDAKQYHIYFRGIVPFMELDEAVARVVMNIFWLTKGDRREAARIISDMADTTTVTSSSCIRRLSLMCKKDAFINAYIRTQSFTRLLSFSSETAVSSFFDGTKK